MSIQELVSNEWALGRFLGCYLQIATYAASSKNVNAGDPRIQVGATTTTTTQQQQLLLPLLLW